MNTATLNRRNHGTIPLASALLPCCRLLVHKQTNKSNTHANTHAPHSGVLPTTIPSPTKPTQEGIFLSSFVG